jgi:hypothetical protein
MSMSDINPGQAVYATDEVSLQSLLNSVMVVEAVEGVAMGCLAVGDELVVGLGGMSETMQGHRLEPRIVEANTQYK